MDIKEFIKTHDLITIGGIEKKLGLTKGTLRIDRDIPERYKGSIESILVNYGYRKEFKIELIREEIKGSTDVIDVKINKKGEIVEVKKEKERNKTIIVNEDNIKEVVKELRKAIPEKRDKAEQAENDRKEKERWERINKYNKNNGVK